MQDATDKLCDLYQRAMILLQYCAPYMEPTAVQLEAQTKQHNEIAGVGGSSAGLASGILGVAAACTSTYKRKSKYCLVGVEYCVKGGASL